MWANRDPQLRKTGRNNIYIKNLSEDIDDKALHDTFSQFGTILSCNVKTNAKGQSAGYGFVHFDTEEAANGATNTVNGKILNGKIVQVEYFKPKIQRRREKALCGPSSATK